MRIETVDLEIQREPFARPFGFKGSYFHEKWNAVVRLTDSDGNEAYGVGGLAVLWADAKVFASHTETGGNLIMLSVLEHALQLCKGKDYNDPMALQEDILNDVHDFALKITNNPDLKLTFTLNALVALDNAAWILHARENGIQTFAELVPDEFRSFFAERQKYVAAVPLLTYKLPAEQIRRILDDGAFFLKIKIGQPGDEEEMLQKDMARLSEIHRLTGDYETDMTESGKVLYYLDANGRYQTRDAFMCLLDHADKIGMLERIALIEEPFAEEAQLDVGGFPCLVAADESVHTVDDIKERAHQGYTALAIKPAGKTLSMGFKSVKAAMELGLACYVADNACVPILVDWNRIFVSHLPAFPSLKCGVLESNGPDSYPNWDEQLARHPFAGAPWLKPVRGRFVLNEDYFEIGGGIFADPVPFSNLFRSGAKQG